MKIITGELEQHITADVAFAIYQYYTATADTAFMEKYGLEMLFEIAVFWASRVEWMADGKAHINNVIGPDEYKEHVNDNAYTNYMVLFALDYAVKQYHSFLEKGFSYLGTIAARTGFDEALPDIGRTISGLYLPKADVDSIIPQCQGYFELEHIDLSKYKASKAVGTIYDDYNMEMLRGIQVLKQADTVLLLLLLEDLFPPEVKKLNYFFYEERTLHDSSLSKSTHSIIASDLGLKEEAYRFFRSSADIDLGDHMHSSDMGIHSAAAGGLWQAVVYGFGGVRIYDEDLRIEPHLPAEWSYLEFTIVWKSSILRICIDSQGMKISNRSCTDVTILNKGAYFKIPAMQEIHIPDVS